VTRPEHLQPTPRGTEIKKKAQFALRHVSICTYCNRRGEPFIVKGDPDGDFWCMDHIVPLYKCGEDALHNLTKSCYACNKKKGASLWQRRLEGMVIPTASGEEIIWSLEVMRKRNSRFAEFQDWQKSLAKKTKQVTKPKARSKSRRKKQWNATPVRLSSEREEQQKRLEALRIVVTSSTSQEAPAVVVDPKLVMYQKAIQNMRRTKAVPKTYVRDSHIYFANPTTLDQAIAMFERLRDIPELR